MIWQVPKIWEGGECWIIGGGPSMPRQFGVPEDVISKVLSQELGPDAYSPYLSPIHEKHVIAINAAFLIGNWMDIVFFGDGNYYRYNRNALLAYPNVKVTCNPKLSDYVRTDRIKYVARDQKHPFGISKRPNHVSWNQNSGAAAISLAYHLGAVRVVLLGFDMMRMEGNRHWHNLYKDKPRTKRRGQKGRVPLPSFHRHLSGFEQIAKDANKLGLEILNVSPDSAITELRKVELKEVL
jgi:hypothetical protein